MEEEPLRALRLMGVHWQCTPGSLLGWGVWLGERYEVRGSFKGH